MRSDKRLCTLTPAPAIVIETLVDDWAMDAGRRTQDACVERGRFPRWSTETGREGAREDWRC
jgi:hypothetical protein